MELYYANGACSLACRIVINEIGLNCQFTAVDLQKKKTEFGDDYMNINNKGAVPALKTDSGELLTENAVILQYLADKSSSHYLLPPTSEFTRYRVLEWVNYIATELHKGFSQFFYPIFTLEIKEKALRPMMNHKLAFVNQRLENHSFLFGDNITLPDPYLFVILTWAEHFNFDLANWPHIKRYFSMLRTYPSVKKSLEQENLV